jgi:hypothetical protein
LEMDHSKMEGMKGRHARRRRIIWKAKWKWRNGSVFRIQLWLPKVTGRQTILLMHQ